MDVTSPQFLYMVLILPSLFGLTLVGEGMTRVMRSQWTGWFSIMAGMGFIGVVLIAYFILSDLL
jgi:hypothetical protein